MAKQELMKQAKDKWKVSLQIVQPSKVTATADQSEKAEGNENKNT